jgi:hypothetical protein
MRTAAPPVTGRRGLSDIAYGFMKALFAALEIGVFTHLAGGPLTAPELATATAVVPHGSRTLLNALAALGLVVQDGDRYANAPASGRYLVRSTASDFGEYFRLQVGRQIHPALVHLDAGIAGTGVAFEAFSGLMTDPAQARTFTAAQHAGSLAAARVLADRLPLDGVTRLLDVGRGSGAFSSRCAAATPACGPPYSTSPPCSRSRASTGTRQASPTASTSWRAMPRAARGRPVRTWC